MQRPRAFRSTTHSQLKGKESRPEREKKAAAGGLTQVTRIVGKTCVKVQSNSWRSRGDLVLEACWRFLRDTLLTRARYQDLN
jgi:hypothetical protein